MRVRSRGSLASVAALANPTKLNTMNARADTAPAAGRFVRLSCAELAAPPWRNSTMPVITVPMVGEANSGYRPTCAEVERTQLIAQEDLVAERNGDAGSGVGKDHARS